MSELFSVEDKNNQYVIESLKHYTLGLPFILDEPNYMTYLQEIDQALKQVILSYYQDRNRLHFTATNFSVFSLDTLIVLIQLINFVNENIVKYHNNLIIDFEYKYNLPLFSEGDKLSEIII